MILDIKDIGIIEKATINLSGLTVISGENNNGKSTVGKILMALIKADNTARTKYRYRQATNFNSNRRSNFNRQLKLLFDKEITLNGKVSLTDEETSIYNINIINNECSSFEGIGPDYRRKYLDCTYIQTPLVWDLYSFFSSVSAMRTEDDIYGYEINIEYPYILWDLYIKLTKKRTHNDANEELLNKVKQIIQGEFSKNSLDNFQYITKNNEGNVLQVPLSNIATGIKSFGILQILLENHYLNNHGLFIFDEPEIHLHPKWQVEFANILFLLSRSGVNIVLNTHSHYIVEAIDKFAIINNSENVNYYIANNGIIETSTPDDIIDSLHESFENIYANF